MKGLTRSIFLLASLGAVTHQAAIAPAAAAAAANNAVLALNSSSTTLTIPPLPNFSMSFAFDNTIRFPPIALYQTAIELMYELANRRYADTVHTMVAGELPGFDMVILFINPAPPSAPQQLQIMHCVFALYRAVVVMTEGVRFCHLRSHLSLMGQEIGAMSISPLVDPPARLLVGGGKNASASSSSSSLSDAAAAVRRGDDNDQETTTLGNGTSTIADGNLKADSGRARDPEYPDFTLVYHFFGKSIQSKEVSMAILAAMATAAPFDVNAECKELLAVSAEGGCVIVVESVGPGAAGIPFTYGWATRALKVLYQGIIVPQKRWGDLVLVLMWKDERFGEMRMLRGAKGETGSGGVASER